MNGLCKITLGAIKKKHFDDMNYNWVENNNNTIMWASSNGKAQNQNFNYLSNFCVKSYQIDARFKKGHLKFSNKKNIGDFIPTNNPS